MNGKRHSTSDRGERGFILLYVVAMVGGMAMILFQLSQMRTGVPDQTERQIARAIETAEARWVADFALAGLHEVKRAPDPRFLAFRRLVLLDPSKASEMEDMLAQIKSILEQMEFKIDLPKRGGDMTTSKTVEEIAYEGQRVLFQNRDKPYVLRLGERDYEIKITPGNAYLNLNGLPFESLMRYFELTGMPSARARELAADLVDWRDRDSFRTDQVGAEAEYYLALKNPYTPRNAPYRHWQELAYVRSTTPELLAKMREVFYLGDPESPQVLIDSQSPEILAALSGLRLDTVKAILGEYGKIEKGLSEKSKVEVAELLLTNDAVAFDRIAGWTPDQDRVRIGISGPNTRLTIDYDKKTRKVGAVW